MIEWVYVKVTESVQGERLDLALVRLLDEVPSRAVASKLVAAGHVLVNGSHRKSSFILKCEDVIAVNAAAFTPAFGQGGELDFEPSPERIPLNILFEDEDILVIHKPPGLVVHPGAGVTSGTLVNAVLGHCGVTLPSLGGRARAGIVHRLDKETSGVMVVAKSQLALTKISEQFASHAQERVYLALTFGCPAPSVGRIETHHGRDPSHRLRYAVLPSGGKPAITVYRMMEPLHQGCYALVSCKLHTGRTHQIRVHLRHLGCPILGDSLYAPEFQFPGQPQLRAALKNGVTRHMLHAQILGFVHPRSGESLLFNVTPPADFQNVLNLLR